MAFYYLSACGLIFEKSERTRLAVARISRRIGPEMRKRTQQDSHLVALSFAMSYESTVWAIELATHSGCVEGLNFVPYAGDEVTGPSPPWLVIADELPEDPLLGLRQETWNDMDPSVREYWENLRRQTHRVFRHVAEPWPSPKTQA